MAAPQGNDVMARASQGRSAISLKRPPQRGHAKTSIPNVRRIKSAHSRASSRGGSPPRSQRQLISVLVPPGLWDAWRRSVATMDKNDPNSVND